MELQGERPLRQLYLMRDERIADISEMDIMQDHMCWGCQVQSNACFHSAQNFFYYWASPQNPPGFRMGQLQHNKQTKVAKLVSPGSPPSGLLLGVYRQRAA